MSRTVWIWMAVSLIFAGIVSKFASSHPDGFEKAGEETGFIESATHIMSSPFPDYSIPGLPSWLSGSLAGILGVLITFGAFMLLGKLFSRKIG